jgi:hypothetical protein
MKRHRHRTRCYRSSSKWNLCCRLGLRSRRRQWNGLCGGSNTVLLVGRINAIAFGVWPDRFFSYILWEFPHLPVENPTDGSWTEFPSRLRLQVLLIDFAVGVEEFSLQVSELLDRSLVEENFLDPSDVEVLLERNDEVHLFLEVPFNLGRRVGWET